MKANKSTPVMMDTLNIPINLYYQLPYSDLLSLPLLSFFFPRVQSHVLIHVSEGTA